MPRPRWSPAGSHDVDIESRPCAIFCVCPSSGYRSECARGRKPTGHRGKAPVGITGALIAGDLAPLGVCRRRAGHMGGRARREPTTNGPQGVCHRKARSADIDMRGDAGRGLRGVRKGFRPSAAWNSQEERLYPYQESRMHIVGIRKEAIPAEADRERRERRGRCSEFRGSGVPALREPISSEWQTSSVSLQDIGALRGRSGRLLSAGFPFPPERRIAHRRAFPEPDANLAGVEYRRPRCC